MHRVMFCFTVNKEEAMLNGHVKVEVAENINMSNKIGRETKCNSLPYYWQLSLKTLLTLDSSLIQDEEDRRKRDSRENKES
ncbi:hypothetical protein YC2023_013319 [Brassica napus]